MHNKPKYINIVYYHYQEITTAKYIYPMCPGVAQDKPLAGNTE